MNTPSTTGPSWHCFLWSLGRSRLLAEPQCRTVMDPLAHALFVLVPIQRNGTNVSLMLELFLPPRNAWKLAISSLLYIWTSQLHFNVTACMKSWVIYLDSMLIINMLPSVAVICVLMLYTEWFVVNLQRFAWIHLHWQEQMAMQTSFKVSAS